MSRRHIYHPGANLVQEVIGAHARMSRRHISLHHRSPALNAPTGEQLAATGARVIDPILTTAAHGYRHPEHVCHHLFPEVPCGARGGTRIEFDRTDFRRVNSRRAFGARTQRVRFGHEGEKFALTHHRLMGVQPIEPAEEAMTTSGIDMSMRAADGAQALISLDHEIEASELARTVGSYAAGHSHAVGMGAKWSAAAGNPTADIMEGVEKIRQAIGVRPNLCLMGGAVFSRVSVHPSVLQQIRYRPGGTQIASAEDLARMWRIDRVVYGDGIYVDEDDNTHDIWGNDVILAYTRVGAISRAEPSFGYGYRLRGRPIVEQPYHERDENVWCYPVSDEWSPEVVGSAAGYLIRGAV